MCTCNSCRVDALMRMRTVQSASSMFDFAGKTVRTKHGRIGTVVRVFSNKYPHTVEVTFFNGQPNDFLCVLDVELATS